MSYLIDTNVVSEIRKGDKANAQVVAWWSAVAEDELWTSTLVLGEIRKTLVTRNTADIEGTGVATLNPWY